MGAFIYTDGILARKDTESGKIFQISPSHTPSKANSAPPIMYVVPPSL
jgi:hypothetical protein